MEKWEHPLLGAVGTILQTIAAQDVEVKRLQNEVEILKARIKDYEAKILEYEEKFDLG